MNSHLLDIFLEQLHSASIIPFASQWTLAALHNFGGDMTLPVIAAITGAALGQLFNWAVGRGLRTLKSKDTAFFQTAGYQKTKATFDRYGVFLLFFSWMPLFNFLTVAAGFLGTPAKILRPVILLGIMLHFTQYLF